MTDPLAAEFAKLNDPTIYQNASMFGISAIKIIREQQRRLEAAREALEFYERGTDNGYTAKQALAALEGKP